MNDFIKNLLEALLKLFGSSPRNTTPAQPQPPVQPHDAAPLEPAVVVSPRVLLIVIDPIIDAANGETLTAHMHWNRPEDLVSTFISDIASVSGGLARYQIVQRIAINEFPAKTDGFRYTPQAYLNVIGKREPAHKPDMIDYPDFLKRHNILELVASNQIDEVWAIGFPYAGFYESTMGGVGAFFCNSDPLENTTTCRRKFVLMGFSNERGPGEMLHSFGHRAESIMEQVYAGTSGSANLWQRFTRYDKIAPGRAEVGTIHFPPNGEDDYDYTNPRSVPSACDEWYDFPNLKGATRLVNKTEWGNDVYTYTLWWLKHLPKVAGRTNGIANNWWQYILDPNRVSA